MANLTELHIDERFSNYIETMSVLETSTDFCIYSVYDNEYDDYSTVFGNTKQVLIKVKDNDIKRGVMCAICDAHKNGYEKIIVLTNKVSFVIENSDAENLYGLLKTYDIVYMNPSEDNDCLMLNKTAIDYIATYNVNIERKSWKTIIDNRVNNKLSVGRMKQNILEHIKPVVIEEVKTYNDEIITTTVVNKQETYEEISNVVKKEEPVDCGSSNPNDVVVWVYTLCYNEEKVLPFIIEYWKKYATRVFVYDNGSTDKSVEILKQYDWIEVRHFDSDGFDDEVNKKTKNQIWKEAKGKGVDFVQVCDLDEVIWADNIKRELLNFKRSNAAIWDCKCYNLISREFPVYEGDLLNNRDGVLCSYDKMMSKKLLFKPDCVDDMNYCEGCHNCKPVGQNVSLYSNDNIKMFHIRNLSLEYMIGKYRHNQKRLSVNNKRHGWGVHYNFSDLRIRREFEGRFKDAIEIRSSKEPKVAVCGIAKYENHYIREWVEHYKKLGVDNIILYDNNDVDGERFEDVIGDYIDSGYVILKDVRGKKGTFEWSRRYVSLQIDCYDECYHEYANDYNWFGFFDIDEFIMLDNGNSIKQQLQDERYKPYDGIKVCWKYYDDNDLVRVVDGNYNCVSRFIHYNPLDDANNKQCKMFIRTNVVKHINSAHIMTHTNRYYEVIKVCDVLGNPQNNRSHELIGNKIIHNIMWLNHYRFKTIDEYIRLKCLRRWPDNFENFVKKEFDADIFFKYNRETEEKKDWFEFVVNNNESVININAWCNFSNNKVTPRNWGDELNFTFIPQLISKKCNLYNKNTQRNAKNFGFIGSLICSSLFNNNTYVWGSGVMCEDRRYTPVKKLYAVRGPKTREYITKQGYSCPEVYGDPALLLPYVYDKPMNKKYKIGIIPHWSNVNNVVFNKFKNDDRVKFINLNNYNVWTDVIDNIRECEFIVSESLHGLIVSEAYSVPNLWMKNNFKDSGYKFHDFFLSLGKDRTNPYTLNNNTTFDDLWKEKQNYQRYFDIDLQKLIDSCPFKLNIKIPKLKTLVCCIAKQENHYIREWVENYKRLGFSNVVIYDNNDIDGEHFEDVIKDYIDSGFVILKNKRGVKVTEQIKNVQQMCYNECYEEYSKTYDWIAYFDVDELLQLDYHNISEFLSQSKFDNFNSVRINWKCFDDNDLVTVKDNDYSLYNRFTRPLPKTHIKQFVYKSIIRGSLDNVRFGYECHGVYTFDNACNVYGIKTNNKSYVSPDVIWNEAYLCHYKFKTIEEFLTIKMNRRFPDRNSKTLTVNRFFELDFNKKTDEKLKFIEEFEKNSK